MSSGCQWGSGVALDASPAPAAPRGVEGHTTTTCTTCTCTCTTCNMYMLTHVDMLHVIHARGQQGCGAPGHIVNYARSPGRRAGGSWTPKLVVDTRARPRHCRVRCGARRPQSMAEARRSAAQERQSTAEETLARVESPAMLRSQRAAACRRSRCYLVPRNLCRAACSDRERERVVRSLQYSPWMALGGKRTRPTNKLSSSPRGMGDTFRRNRKLPQGRNRGRLEKKH